jgi:hypothetical protein
MAAHEITTNDSGTSESTGNTPVACSLTPAGLAAQAGRWERLAARAMIERARTAHGIRIWFRPEPGAEEELRVLVAVENGCCPWATWTVQPSGGQIMLDVRSSGDGITALHGMFTGLRQS